MFPLQLKNRLGIIVLALVIGGGVHGSVPNSCEDSLQSEGVERGESTSIDERTLVAESEKMLFPDQPNPHELVKIADDAAFESMSQVMITGAQAQTEVRQWFEKIKEEQDSGRKLTVLEHTALLHLLRTDFLKEDPDPRLIAEIQSCLVRSWYELTGNRAEIEQILNLRLPRFVLRQASHEARQFHAAVFQSPRSSRGTAVNTGLGKDYVPLSQDAFTAMGLVAMGFTHTGGQVLAGAVTGYLLGAVIENLIHRFVMHPDGRLMRKFADGGWFGKNLYDVAFEHSGVHHARTFRPRYTRQFESLTQQEKLDAMLQEKGVDVDDIHDTDYGLTFTPKSVAILMMTVMPFAAVLNWAMGLEPSGTLSLFASSMAFIPAVKILHEYMHKPRAQALTQANFMLRWFLKTRYFAMVARQHFVHHEAPNSNYNFMPGGDIFFGTLRKPTVEELLRLKELDAIF